MKNGIGSGRKNPYLKFLKNLPSEEDDESQGILSGLQSWLGFAGSMMGPDTAMMTRSIIKKKQKYSKSE